MWIKSSQLAALSADIRRAVDGQAVDPRDDREGPLSVLKNDIYTLASLKDRQIAAARAGHERLSEYLADISHQLKTPITSISIMADLLETAPPEKQGEFISNIRLSASRMEWLTSSLLKMASLDAGEVSFSPAQVSAEDLLALALEPLSILLDVKAQKLSLLHDAPLLCDRRWTAEALSNLVKNASEHSPEGGEICVDSGENPLCRWISVRDTGSGIARETVPLLFKRFKGSATERGCGIGLPLALSIVRGQGGDIDVDCGGHGTGATFTVKFYKEI